MDFGPNGLIIVVVVVVVVIGVGVGLVVLRHFFGQKKNKVSGKRRRHRIFLPQAENYRNLAALNFFDVSLKHFSEKNQIFLNESHLK